jgi:TonB family protein
LRRNKKNSPETGALSMPTLPLTLCLWFSLSVISMAQSGNSNMSLPGSKSTFESVRLSEIVITTPQPYDPLQVAQAQQKAEDLRDAIERGADFSKLARSNSQVTAAEGGDLGFFAHGTLAPSIEEAVFAMKIGEVTDVIRTKYAFVILKVTDRRLPSVGPVEVLNAPLTQDLQSYLEQLVGKVSQRWQAEILPSALRPELKQGSVAIEFAIKRDGSLDEHRISASYGNFALDDVALGIVMQAAPFVPIPRSIKVDRLELRFNFEYSPNHFGK